LIRGTPQPTPEVIVRPSVIRAPPVRRPFTISYEVEVVNLRTGKRVCAKGDLFTNNFDRFIQLVFTNVKYGTSVTITGFVDVSGTSRSLIVGHASYCWDYAYDHSREWFIRVGKGSGTPSTSDYELFDFVQHGKLTFAGTSLGDTEAVVELKAGMSATTTYDITELGLTLGCPDSNDVYSYFMLTHDVLPEAVHVDEGDGFTAMYRFRFTW